MKGTPICFCNDGLTFGSLLRGPHIPPIGLQASLLHHLVEKLCHCFTVSVNSLVAKWRRSADGLLWLSSLPLPLVFAALTVKFYFKPLGGGQEPASFTFFNLSNKKKRRPLPRGCSGLDVLGGSILVH